MKQIIQHLNDGRTMMVDVPAPTVKDDHILIQSECSLVSAGTERMLLEFGKANWWNKARQQPDRVRDVIDKIKTDGLLPTVQAVRSKLQTPIPLGYANAGRVIAVGKNVREFTVGDRVVSNGPHAEFVQVSRNLAARIPDNVSMESAAFTVVAAIALQGIRLVQPTLGETVVVFGLGLIGQLTVQLLLANGCRVIGIDTDESKCNLAKSYGATVYCNEEDRQPVDTIVHTTSGMGVDAVIITASSRSDTIISNAAQMLRKRGRVILVGVVGLSLNRADFYQKEISFQVSCSYGPGRYDFDYEEYALDYPPGFVRWTAQRNFQAVLHALSTGALKTDTLISQKVPFYEFEQVYRDIDRSENIASLFLYDLEQPYRSSITYTNVYKDVPEYIAVIGAGNFMARTILPYLQKQALSVKKIVSKGGLSAARLAQQFKIPEAATDVQAIWEDDSIGHVVIATPHYTHADLCMEALRNGKHVFIEKPLAITRQELECMKTVYTDAALMLNVGFNRRFAPLSLRAMKLLQDIDAPIQIVMTINAGYLPPANWHTDQQQGGGRIIGEVCHFIDLASFFTRSAVKSVCANQMAESREDASILLQYANGSNAVINYFTNGNKAYDKERVEIYAYGKVIVIENWKSIRAYGFKQGVMSHTATQDKGHDKQFALWASAVRGNKVPLIPFEEIYNTSLATIAVTESIAERRWIVL